MWLKKIPVKPKVMIKHYLPNINKIIIAQRQIKKFIQVKIKHSHNCPYSLERYTDIPEKYRVVYEYREGNSMHWRYFNIKWLDSDWKSQTECKRYVIEQTTKYEFSEDFVEQIARQMWKLSRKENDFCLDSDETKTEYPIENDWENSFMRRSFYRFSLMVLDMCDILGVDLKNIKYLRDPNIRLNYQLFYLKIMPALKNIANNTHTHAYSRRRHILYYKRHLQNRFYISKYRHIRYTSWRCNLLYFKSITCIKKTK